MSYPGLENFIARVKVMKASGSNELRVTKKQAEEMSLELTDLLLKRPTDKIIITQPSKGPVTIDGGGF